MLKKTAEQSTVKPNSVIGADMVVEGNIKAKETIRVEGCVIGDIEAEGSLIISATGKVKGNIKGHSIMVGGVLEGDLACSEKTEVIATGKVFGDMHTKSLIVDENAVFEGRCVMNEEEVANRMKPENTSENGGKPEEGNDGQKKK